MRGNANYKIQISQFCIKNENILPSKNVYQHNKNYAIFTKSNFPRSSIHTNVLHSQSLNYNYECLFEAYQCWKSSFVTKLI